MPGLAALQGRLFLDGPGRLELPKSGIQMVSYMVKKSMPLFCFPIVFPSFQLSHSCLDELKMSKDEPVQERLSPAKHPAYD